VKPKILEERITDVEKIIVDIVNERKKLFSGELYNCYRDRAENPISERAFRDYVNHLTELGMIAIQEKSRGVVGRKRLVLKA
jgi:Cdc6-like AAA superfamily ATPase